MQNTFLADEDQMRRYTQHYTYDEAGNMLEMSHVASSSWTRTFGIVSGCNRIATNSVGSNTTGSETYTYDNRGNITGGMNHLTSMTYNDSNRLEVVVHADTNITTYYQYDGNGQRVRKVTIDDNNDLQHVNKYIGGWEVYSKIDTSSTPTIVLERETLHIKDDKQRIAIIDTPTIDTAPTGEVQVQRFQLSNHLGTATVELNEDGNIITYEEYYPFGSTAFHSKASSPNISQKRYRFTGKEKDEETGFYYMGARYYVPWLARWCAADPMQSEMPEWSSYNYGFCNPIKWTDPTGMVPQADDTPKNQAAEQVNDNNAKEGVSSEPVVNAPIIPADALSVAPVKIPIEQGGDTYQVPDKQETIDVNYTNTIWSSKAGRAYAEKLIEQEAALVPYGSIGIKAIKGEEITKGDVLLETAATFLPIGKFGKIIGSFIKQTFKYSQEVSSLIAGTYKEVKAGGVVGKEIITVTKSGSYKDAKTVVKDLVGDLGDDAVEYTSRTKGPFEGQVTGVQSARGKSGWRIDWDANKGAHINWWSGKQKGAIPFSGNLEKAKSMVINKTF